MDVFATCARHENSLIFKGQLRIYSNIFVEALFRDIFLRPSISSNNFVPRRVYDVMHEDLGRCPKNVAYTLIQKDDLALKSNMENDVSAHTSCKEHSRVSQYN